MDSRGSQPEFEFDLSGGNLCLDFANTVSQRKLGKQAADHLTHYDDLVSFAAQSKLISPRRAQHMRTQARRKDEEARRVLAQAVVLRESIYRAFSALARDKQPAQSDVRTLSDFALAAMKQRRLAAANGGYRWEWEPGEKARLDRVLWPVALSAAELLTSGDLGTLRECQAQTCAWLFLDNSRNRSRRWCDMKVCGNREKARRHYRRSKP